MTLYALFNGLFFIAWLSGVVSWFIGTVAMLRWMGLRPKPEAAPYLRKSFKAGAVMAVSAIFGLAIGFLGIWLGVLPSG